MSTTQFLKRPYVKQKLFIITMNLIKKKEEQYSTCLGNHKWSYIEEKQKGKLHKTIIKDGKQIHDPKKIVETFNYFFINIGPNRTKNMETNQNKHFLKFLNQNILTSFSFTLDNEKQIKEVIFSLHTKHSSGHDGISVKPLKFLAPALVRPLTLIINRSLITGIFPDKLKIAKVIPLYKKMISLLWITIDQYLYYLPHQKFSKRLCFFNYQVAL